MSVKSFPDIVESLLQRHKESDLRDRWEEAISFGAGTAASAFLIRETKQVVNVVWLNRDGIRDITFVYGYKGSIFNFVPLKHITTFEVQTGPNIARSVGLDIEGNLLVRVILPTISGRLYWIAGTKKEAKELRAFLAKVLTAYAKAT